MLRSKLLCGASGVAALLTLGLAASGAHAEAAAVGEITVTGSYIAGTPETAALPVTVTTADTLAKQGSPSIVELTKMLPESAGIISESNQFGAGGRGQGAEGTSTINLRGLGPERTLVLLNGHRLPLYVGLVVDTTSLPLSAVGRIEVLKEGAAATYGSDAIGGVVNFITKKNFRGLELGADFRYVEGSKGDYTINATWGYGGDNWNVLWAAGHQHRSALPIAERPDWALRPYNFNPDGGWSGASSPTEFIPVGPFGPGGALIPLAGTRVDLGCATVGGILTNPNANASPLLPFSNCRMQYTPWDNLEERQNSYQVYGEFNYALGEHTRLHLEGMFSYNEVPHANTTPSYATSRPIPSTVLPAGIPTGGSTGYIPGTSPLALNFFFVPRTNPGFAAYAAANPGQFPAIATGAFITIGTFRPFFAGGNPFFNYQESFAIRRHSVYRLSGDLKGKLGGINWDTSLTYGEYRNYTAGRDTVTDRLELALRGFGGPNCNFATDAPGVGNCSWYNPFSNAIPSAPKFNNNANNPSFSSSLANSAALAEWLMPYQSGTQTYRNIEYDIVLDGKLPVSLPGGEVGWAGGFQLRHNTYHTTASAFANAQLMPCADTPVTGSKTCTPKSGPSVFLGVANPVDLSQSIYAAFGELSIPVYDRLNIDLAARFEDYGKNGGNTWSPQARAKWQVIDWFAVRGSIGTTFRAPPQGFLIPDPATSLQQVLGTFRPVDTIGNPNLTPEKARVYSVGAIFEAGGLRLTVDYWNYMFTRVITSEPLTSVVASLFPNGTGIGDNCATLSPTFIADHFEFSGACSAANVTKVKLLRINGPKIKLAGVDFNGRYQFRDVWGGDLALGGNLTYIDHYTVGGFTVGGVPIAGYEAAGFINIGQATSTSLPKWRGQGYIEFNKGPLNIRWTGRYTSSYEDQRAALFKWNASYQTLTLAQCGNANATTAPPTVSAACGTVTRGQTIKAIVLNDLAIQWKAPGDVTATVAINNVFDLNPPFARLEVNYDPVTADPLGRTFKIGLSKRF